MVGQGERKGRNWEEPLTDTRKRLGSHKHTRCSNQASRTEKDGKPVKDTSKQAAAHTDTHSWQPARICSRVSVRECEVGAPASTLNMSGALL